MTADRTILHADMDAFFASVEQRDHPEFRGEPVIVGSPPDKRGVVSAASYEARSYGIRSAMPSREAGRRCPHAIFVRPNMQRYRAVSRQIHQVFSRFTPDVESISVDEAFLDVTGVTRLHGDGPTIARKLKDAVRNELELTVSVGVATNKFLAKLASDMDKPDGLTVVPDTEDAIVSFLRPLPVRAIWGVGKVTAGRLIQRGINTIAQLQDMDTQMLATIIGQRSAVHLKQLALGRDTRPVADHAPEKSISREHTFDQDCRDIDVLRRTLFALLDNVGGQLRATGKRAATLHLKLRWSDFSTVTRQRALKPPCCDDQALGQAATELFEAATIEHPVRLIGVGVSHLVAPENQAQLDFFDQTPERQKTREQLAASVDAIRNRFGTDAIRRGGAT